MYTLAALKSVYTIIVTYNGIQWIAKCLNSVINSTYKVNAIVIDNASIDDTVSCIECHFPEVMLVKLKKNLGFGAANNVGMRMALAQNADYVFLLNQDAWVEPDTIGALISVHLQHPALGIVSPLHLNGKGSDLDLYFRQYLTRSNREGFLKDALIHTEFVNAAAWLISIDCLKAIGGFASVFFHYGEDDNYAQRVIYRRFKIGIYTQAKIYHDREDRILNNHSDARRSAAKDYINFLNQACDLRKHGYWVLWLKRTARYSIMTCLSIFNKSACAYNYLMACRIAGSVFKIRKTRHVTSRTNPIPYL